MRSSLRDRPASHTLAAAKALLPTLGISRLTDITRLDRLGLPVFASVRPRAAELRVHAGKGLRRIDAAVGAAMEAIEFAVAEPDASNWAPKTLQVAAVAAQLGAGTRFVDLVPKIGVEVLPRQRITTVECEELGTGRSVWLPAELVFVPYEPAPRAKIFGWTSNGLASGNSLDEATLHGLLEVLERDAIAMNRPRDESCWIDPQEFPLPLRRLPAQWRSLGVELAVRYVPNAFGLPCFEARLHEPNSTDVNLAGGSGLHLLRDIALTRAVCEAAQSRAGAIHGGREDLTTFYAKYADRTALAMRESRAIAQAFDRSRRIRYTDVSDVSRRGRPIAELLSDLRRRLAERGFERVYRHRFAVDLAAMQVVKVIVPKAEEHEHNPWRVGPRLLARTIGDA